MRKIIFVLTLYEIGGASRVVKNLLDCLDTDRFDIVLLTQKLSDRHYPVDNRTRLINLDISPQKTFFAKVHNVARHLILMRKIIIAESPDVIFSFTSQANCYILLSLLFRKKRPKIIVDEQTEEMFISVKTKNLK